MRILDKDGNEFTAYDASSGYVTEENIVVAHHEAVEKVEEQGHWETIREYPNGGKDVEWIVDVPGTEAQKAYDESETILRYTPYTESQLATVRIEVLKQKLLETDYNILKVVEGAQTLEACAEVVKRRAAWRKEINQLEKLI